MLEMRQFWPNVDQLLNALWQQKQQKNIPTHNLALFMAQSGSTSLQYPLTSLVGTYRTQD